MLALICFNTRCLKDLRKIPVKSKVIHGKGFKSQVREQGDWF